ncbi:MAG: serine/threonine-protein kinase [bacterium]
MTSPHDLPPSLVEALAGNYELLQEIGRGGMGVVYAGRDLRLDRLVAIKVLPELVSSDVVRERFLREARAAARLSHPSIVPIYSADDRAGVTFLVMAYVDGMTLSARIRDGALSPAQAVPILRDVALALNAAHARSVIHRDVKPENILVDRVTGRAMVTDFGIARLADALQSGALTRTGQVLGTVGYMSPEQVTGADVDGRSDLYSLGVVAFETLSGRLPFDGPAPVVIVAHATRPAPPLASVAPNVPAALCEIVDRCLRKDPDHRFQSGDELAAALEAAVGASVATAPVRIDAGLEERVLTEVEADRVWKRAAELQAGIGSPNAPRAPTASTMAVPRDLPNGFRMEHVRLAALEAGISAPYVSLALDELLRPHAGLVAPSAVRPGPVVAPAPLATLRANQVKSLSPATSSLAGAPTALAYEVEVMGQLSPNDFDVIAQTIRSSIGEAGVATALGRTLTWSPAGSQNQRKLHVSLTAAGGKTHIRAEERMGPYVGGIFGGVVGGGGGAAGAVVFGLTMANLHAPLAGFVYAGCVVAGAYLLARTIYTRTVQRRAWELEGLMARLAVQVADLVADDPPHR